MNAPLKDALVLFMPSGRRGRFPRRHAGARRGALARRLHRIASAAGAASAGAARSRWRKAQFAKHGITSSHDHLSPFTDTEARYVSHPRRAWRASAASPAHATIQGDLVVDVPQDVQINRQIVRKRAETRLIERDPITQLCYVEVDEPDMHKPLGDTDRLLRVLAKDWRLRRAAHRLPSAAEGAENPARGRVEGDRRRAPRPRRAGGDRALAGPAQFRLRDRRRHRLDHDRLPPLLAALRPHARLRRRARTRRSASARI